MQVQERLESSDVGRSAISGFLLITLVVIVALILPYTSTLRRTLMPLTEPYRAITGLEQTWSVFAPDARRDVIDWYATVEMEDGSVDIWRIPDGGPLLGSFRVNRWRKWMEVVTVDAYRGLLFETTARFVARQVPGGPDGAVRTTFVRRSASLPPPGAGAQLRWRDTAYYTLRLK
jgi:hypothetical protein